MLLPETTNRVCVEDPFLLEAVSVQQRIGPVTEGAPEPLGQRNAEPHLRAFYQTGRYVLMEQLTKNPFSFAIPIFEASGDIPGALDHAMVEEWSPGL